MRAYSNLLTLLDRNIELFKGKKALFLGEIADENLLHIAKVTSKAVLISDSFAAAERMAGLFNQELSTECPQRFTYKHIEILFAARMEAASMLEGEFDLVLLLVNKTKNLSAALLAALQKHFAEGALILTAGANDAGGKSADKLLASCSEIYKADTARKCTLFAGTYSKAQPFAAPKKPAVLKLILKNRELSLLQDPGVFSPSVLDEGTKLLLETIPEELPAGCRLLDLCCGCGLVGALLSPKCAAVTYSDVSAEALSLTKENLKALGLEGTVVASNFLSRLGSFDVIAVNPPFHQGVKVSSEATLQMLREIPIHLNRGGTAYVVYNSFLDYAGRLRNDLGIEELVKTPRFSIAVIRA